MRSASATEGAARPTEPAAAGDVRQRILDVALERFAERGYEGASLQDMVDAAHTTKPMVYYYFGGKAGLFEHVVRSAIESMREGVAAVSDDGRPLREALAAVADRWLCAGDRRPAEVKLWANMHFQPQAFPPGSRSHEAFADLRQKLIDWAERAKDAGEVSHEPEEIVLGFVVLVRGLVGMRALAPEAVRPSLESARRVVSILLDGIQHTQGERT